MKATIKGIMVAAMLCLCGTAADAQLLRLHVQDAMLQKHVFINYSPEYDYIGSDYTDPKFDANGDYDFNPVMPCRFNWVEVGRGDVSEPVIIEQGKTADVYIERDKKGKPVLTVKSDNRRGDAYIAHLYRGTSTTAITGYGRPEDRVPAEEGLRQLDSTMVVLRKELKKVRPAALNDFLARLTDAVEIHYKLEILSNHRDTRVYYNLGQPEYNRVAEQIKANDPIYLRYRLNDRYICQQMTEDDLKGDDLTGYGLKFIEKMKASGIENSLVKHVVLGRLADFVLFESHPNDVDPFWNALTEYAAGDTALTNRFSAQIASLRATKQGNPATDETFSDSTGTSHSFGEYKGKVLYVDLWATWCVPCQHEIPFFKKVAEHYKDNPAVQLISVSIDKEGDRAKWLKQIRRERPSWPQFIMSDAEHAKVTKDYGVAFIPRFILIDKDGNLASADALRPSDPEIYKTIDDLLK